MAIFCNQSKAWMCQPFNYMLLTLYFAIFASDSLESFYANLKGNKRKENGNCLLWTCGFQGNRLYWVYYVGTITKKGDLLEDVLLLQSFFLRELSEEIMGKRTIGKKGKILNIRDTCWSGFKVSKCVVVNKMETQSAMFKVEKL